MMLIKLISPPLLEAFQHNMEGTGCPTTKQQAWLASMQFGLIGGLNTVHDANLLKEG